ncbi:hypothetical protein [Marinospirillum minutulum]|uniref:hypothetical protein n=1 Tax=Marinospirillum minutulum TaxID=64974 RepID=UPI0004122360|nr:hypothetical protein [Marinospirillum minutulum]
MSIENYADLITTAKNETNPQRLLFVFAKAVLPDDATPEEKAAFEKGEGGALDPILCVDKTPEEAASFATLVAEAETTGHSWDVAFISAMSGHAGQALNSDECVQPLNMMVEQIRLGKISQFLAISRDGELIEIY